MWEQFFRCFVCSIAYEYTLIYLSVLLGGCLHYFRLGLLQTTHINILVQIRFRWAEVDLRCYRVGLVFMQIAEQLSKAATLLHVPAAGDGGSHHSLPSKCLSLSNGGFLFGLRLF